MRQPRHLAQLACSLAQARARHGIRVNAVVAVDGEHSTA